MPVADDRVEGGAPTGAHVRAERELRRSVPRRAGCCRRRRRVGRSRRCAPTKTFVPAGASGSSGWTAAPVAGSRNRRPAGPGRDEDARGQREPVDLAASSSRTTDRRCRSRAGASRRFRPLRRTRRGRRRSRRRAAVGLRSPRRASRRSTRTRSTARTCGSAAVEAAGASVSAASAAMAASFTRERIPHGMQDTVRIVLGGCASRGRRDRAARRRAPEADRRRARLAARAASRATPGRRRGTAPHRRV